MRTRRSSQSPPRSSPRSSARSPAASSTRSAPSAPSRRPKRSANRYKKRPFPVDKIRRFLEPGPIVLVTSRYRDEINIMTMGWHVVMETDPSLIGCYIWTRNHSFDLLRRSKQCVINIPTADLAKTVVDIGNSSGRDIDKFATFALTPEPATIVDAPLIAECFANLECKLVDASLIRKYSFFVWEVVAAHAPRTPTYPRTIHYTGDGVFMVSGKHIDLSARFKPEML
jgi:flavin reductase (DIM6/NTAB) family NADH-FMN oxidoreductase RutF